MATEIYQGENKTLVIGSGEDLTSYTEIEFIIDSPTQIKKSLTGGEISNVTTTSFDVAISPADTERVPAGKYKYQTRATDASGNIYHGKIVKNFLTILHSAFVNPTGGNDYA